MTSITKNNFTAHITSSDFAESPRGDFFGDSNLSKLGLSHKRMNLCNELEINTDNFDSWDEVEQDLKNQFGSDLLFIKPVYMYDHSSISLSYNSNCRFDSGVVGFQVVLKSDVCDIFNVKRISANLLKKVEEQAKDELEDYSNYLNGDVYRVTFEEGDEILEDMDVDNIYGYKNAENVANETLEELVKQVA